MSHTKKKNVNSPFESTTKLRQYYNKHKILGTKNILDCIYLVTPKKLGIQLQY